MRANMDNILAEQAITYITELFEGNAGGHDAEHTMRVYRCAMRIADRLDATH